MHGIYADFVSRLQITMKSLPYYNGVGPKMPGMSTFYYLCLMVEKLVELDEMMQPLIVAELVKRKNALKDISTRV